MTNREDIEQKFDTLIDQFGLAPLLSAAELDRIAGNAYHNDYHVKCMVLLCHGASVYYNMSFPDTKNLLIAALFHDYLHSGGRETDDRNISRACERLNYVALDTSQRDMITRFIKCTEYPFRKEREPFCIEMKILRDADVMQSIMPDWPKMYKGLQLEVSIATGEVISDKEWFELTGTFYEKVVLHTQWAIETIQLVRSMCLFMGDYHAGWHDANMTGANTFTGQRIEFSRSPWADTRKAR